MALPGMVEMAGCFAQIPAAVVCPDMVETKDCPPRIPAARVLPGMVETKDCSARIPAVPAAEAEDTVVVAARVGSQAVERAAAQDSGVPIG